MPALKADAGCVMSLCVLLRVAAAALNYEIYSILDGASPSAPSITELSDHSGSYGGWRFSLGLASLCLSAFECAGV